MSDITVPPAYKYLVATKRQTTEDYKPKIRHYIDSRPKQALTNAGFQELLGTSSAMIHVKKLMKQGHVTRDRVRAGKGKRYSYRWHDQALDYEQAMRKSGLVITKDLQLPEFKLKGLLEDLDQLAYEWGDTVPVTGDDIMGVIRFRKWLKVKEKEVATTRAALLDSHVKNKE